MTSKKGAHSRGLALISASVALLMQWTLTNAEEFGRLDQQEGWYQQDYYKPKTSYSFANTFISPDQHNNRRQTYNQQFPTLYFGEIPLPQRYQTPGTRRGREELFRIGRETPNNILGSSDHNEALEESSNKENLNTTQTWKNGENINESQHTNTGARQGRMIYHTEFVPTASEVIEELTGVKTSLPRFHDLGYKSTQEVKHLYQNPQQLQQSRQDGLDEYFINIDSAAFTAGLSNNYVTNPTEDYETIAHHAAGRAEAAAENIDLIAALAAANAKNENKKNLENIEGANINAIKPTQLQYNPNFFKPSLPDPIITGKFHQKINVPKPQRLHNNNNHRPNSLDVLNRNRGRQNRRPHRPQGGVIRIVQAIRGRNNNRHRTGRNRIGWYGGRRLRSL